MLVVLFHSVVSTCIRGLHRCPGEPNAMPPRSRSRAKNVARLASYTTLVTRSISAFPRDQFPFQNASSMCIRVYRRSREESLPSLQNDTHHDTDCTTDARCAVSGGFYNRRRVVRERRREGTNDATNDGKGSTQMLSRPAAGGR